MRAWGGTEAAEARSLLASAGAPLAHGDGISVSYGNVGDGLAGERGGGGGLRVAFRTNVLRPTPRDAGPPAELIEVILGGRVLVERWLSPSDPPLRAETYRPLKVEYEESKGLTVALDGVALIRQVVLPAWQPRPSWRFAVGARCSGAIDGHSIRRLRLTTGRLLTGGGVDVAVTLNAQDFDTSEHSTRPPSTTTPPTPSTPPEARRRARPPFASAAPRSIAGRRADCATAASVLRRPPLPAWPPTVPTCCAPRQARPTLSVRPWTWKTSMRSAGAVGRAEVRLSLNGLDELAVANFSYYLTPSVTHIYPGSGSGLGGVTVAVYGSRLAPTAREPRCRFGTVDVAASVAGASHDLLRCVAPRLDPALGAVPLLVSLDGEQYVGGGGVEWTPLDVLEVVSLQPSSGPVYGGTNVTVLAHGGASGTEYLCRFGNSTVAATVIGSAASLEGAAEEGAAESGGGGTSSDVNSVESVASYVWLRCFSPPATVNLTNVSATLAKYSLTVEAMVAIAEAERDRRLANASANVSLAEPLVSHGTPLAGDTNATNATSAANGTQAPPPEPYPPTAPPATPPPPIFTIEEAIALLPPAAYWPAGLPLGVPVEVSANGIDFSRSAPRAPPFVYAEPVPTLLEAAPQPPLGPVDGGTHVTLHGVPTDGATRPLCQFGDEKPVGATRGASRALSCVAPPSATAAKVPVSLSLNGQQWTTTAAMFAYLEAPSLEGVLPDLSPNSGGLVLEGLRATTSAAGTTTAAALTTRPCAPPSEPHDAQTASVLCVSPPGLLGEASVHVALNGQQYSQHSHARPAPRIMYYDALPRAATAGCDARGVAASRKEPVATTQKPGMLSPCNSH